MTRTRAVVSLAIVAVLGVAYLAVARADAPHKGQTSACGGVFSSYPYTWGEYAAILNARIQDGYLDPNAPMVVCVVHKDGRKDHLPVYAIAKDHATAVVNMTALP